MKEYPQPARLQGHLESADSDASGDSAEVSTAFPDVCEPHFIRYAEDPSREEICINTMATALRGMVENGQISEAQADKKLFEYRVSLEQHPFSSGSITNPTREQFQAVCRGAGVEPPAWPLAKNGWQSPIFMMASKSAEAPQKLDREAIIAAHPLVEYCMAHGIKLLGNGPKRTCRCPLPGHEDKHPSCAVDLDKQLLHCHGCGKAGTVIDLHAGLNGWDPKADFVKVVNDLCGGKVDQDDDPAIVAKYDYHKADGAFSYQKARYAPGHQPRFRIRHKENGKWVYTQGGPALLYHLPKLAKAAHYELVFIVEGEKDVRTLEDNLSAVATTSGGVKSWKDEFAGFFKSRDVIICPDADAEGEGYCQAVGRSLLPVANSVRVARLPEGFKDVTELYQGNPANFEERFQEAVAAAKPFADFQHGANSGEAKAEAANGGANTEEEQAPRDEDDSRDHTQAASNYWRQLEALADTAARKKIPIERVLTDLRDKLPGAPAELPPLDSADVFCAEPDDTPPEVIEGILHQGSKGELGGGSKAFKTWTLLQMGSCVAAGLPWLDFKTHAGEVLYINFELPRWSIRKRIKSISAALGTAPPKKLKLLNLRGYGSDANIILPRIAKEIKEHAFVLIIIDPLYKILGDREENATKDMADLMLAIEKLATEANAAVLFGAHFSKGNQSLKEAMDRISGSGVLARDPDTIITMTQHEEKEAYTVDMILRSFAPQEPFVVQRVHPLMIRAAGLDPARLKQPKKSNQSVYSSDDLLEVLKENGGSLGAKEWREKCEAKIGLKATTFYKFLKELRGEARIFHSELDKKWSLKP